MAKWEEPGQRDAASLGVNWGFTGALKAAKGQNAFKEESDGPGSSPALAVFGDLAF